MNSEDKFIVFDDTSFSDLLKDIYDTSQKKKEKIDSLIEQLSNMTNSLNDALLTVPLIKDYLDVGVKNDEHVLKIATIVQRHISNINKSSTSDTLLLTEDEKLQLLEIAEADVKKLTE